MDFRRGGADLVASLHEHYKNEMDNRLVAGNDVIDIGRFSQHQEPVVISSKRKSSPPINKKNFGTRESGSSGAYGGNKGKRPSAIAHNQLYFLRESEKKASHAKNYSTQDHRTLQFQSFGVLPDSRAIQPGHLSHETGAQTSETAENFVRIINGNGNPRRSLKKSKRGDNLFPEQRSHSIDVDRHNAPKFDPDFPNLSKRQQK